VPAMPVELLIAPEAELDTAEEFRIWLDFRGRNVCRARSSSQSFAGRLPEKTRDSDFPRPLSE